MSQVAKGCPDRPVLGSICYDHEPGQGQDDFPKSLGHSYGTCRLVNLSKLFRFDSFTGGQW